MSDLERLKELTARLKHGKHDQSTHGRKRGGGGGGKRGGGGAASAPASNSDENRRRSNNREAMNGSLKRAASLSKDNTDMGQGASRAASIMRRHLRDGDARAAYQQITSEYRKLANKRDRAQQAGKRDVADKYQKQGSGMLLVRDSMISQISPGERRLIEN